MIKLDPWTVGFICGICTSITAFGIALYLFVSLRGIKSDMAIDRAWERNRDRDRD